MNTPRARRRPRDFDVDRGSATLELVVWAPVLPIVLALVVFAGRLVLGHQSVEQAATDAARQASISRTAFGAEQAARSSATNTLAQQGLRWGLVEPRTTGGGETAAAGRSSAAIPGRSTTARSGVTRCTRWRR